MSAKPGNPEPEHYTRRDALAALAKYSAGLGGTAAGIVSAESLVSAASAYPAVCETRPSSPACPGGIPPGQDGGGGNSASANGRVLF